MQWSRGPYSRSPVESYKRRVRASPQVDLLTELHRLNDADAKQAAFRKAMADLAALAAERRPVPLEGLDPDALAAGVREALSLGLLDDLSFLSEPAAAGALYQLAAGLPKGPERQEAGRRVLALLNTSAGQTFATLAASLALGSRDPFQDAALRARVSLTMELPLGESGAADSLALALISRPHLRRAWLSGPSTGALPGRRLASRLLERAASEAVRRAAQGDDAALSVFSATSVRSAWKRLLSDRETLVWRHAACARGLLSVMDPDVASGIDADLDEALSPTEWRRAVVALVASIAVRPQAALRGCLRVLSGPLPGRDRGLVDVMMFGVARAAESEPRAALSLLERLVEEASDVGAEELLLVVAERVVGENEGRVLETAAAWVENRLDDDSQPVSRLALSEQLLRELRSEVSSEHQQPLHQQLMGTLAAVAAQGPAAAEESGRHLLAEASERLSELEATDDDGRQACLLRELDLALCQRGLLNRLLTTVERPMDAQAELDRLLDRLTSWLLTREASGPDADADLGLHMRRLVTLLHIVDGDGRKARGASHMRQLATARALLDRASQAPTEGEGTGLSRVSCATLARSFDALVRDEIFELSDVILATSLYVVSHENVTILAEASMDPQLEAALFAYGWFCQTATDASEGAGCRREALDALSAFAKAIPTASSPRVEALRQATLALSQALEALSRVPCLWGLLDGAHADDLHSLAEACQGLTLLCAGAERRWRPEGQHKTKLAMGRRVSQLWEEVERALSEDEEVGWARVMPALSACARKELPGPLSDLVLAVVSALTSLPEHPDPRQQRSVAPPAPPKRLPGWLPPSRVLGGFYVLETLGEGAVGSVFIATRAEDRGRDRAPRFALKVPAYDGQAARALSEEEFLNMFRLEAGALLALPKHPNLASFVTFDAGARPKPVLVMQLVEGPSLARLLTRGRLTCALALELLDGIAAGLSTMHDAGVGHLDVKPGNVIVHTGLDGQGRPVLVDFGLSGRHLRPGCATTAYGAPEIWGLLPDPDHADPAPADVYAFACLVYEVLAGRDLFPAGDEMATISAHITHDGRPPRLHELAAAGAPHQLIELLERALRKNPRDRLCMADMRTGLAALAAPLSGHAWPLMPRLPEEHAA